MKHRTLLTMMILLMLPTVLCAQSIRSGERRSRDQRPDRRTSYPVKNRTGIQKIQLKPDLDLEGQRQRENERLRRELLRLQQLQRQQAINNAVQQRNAQPTFGSSVFGPARGQAGGGSAQSGGQRATSASTAGTTTGTSTKNGTNVRTRVANPFVKRSISSGNNSANQPASVVVKNPFFKARKQVNRPPVVVVSSDEEVDVTKPTSLNSTDSTSVPKEPTIDQESIQIEPNVESLKHEADELNEPIELKLEQLDQVPNQLYFAQFDWQELGQQTVQWFEFVLK